MKRSGTADLPLHHGHVPQWLSKRMAALGLAITEAVITAYGTTEVLRRLSDPFWFQSLGAVMGMDWHSSGISTSVMGALKRAINPRGKELGIYICGGKGKASRQTPAELIALSEKTGFNGDWLVRCSKLSAKVDNTAVQDGFQLYMHNFVVNDQAQWTVVQQGMQPGSATARRYHWHSSQLKSFVDDPHTGICGANQGEILNMADTQALPARNAIMQMSQEPPEKMIAEIQQLVMPRHHQVTAKDVDLKRLGSTLWLAHEKTPADFEELLLLQGVGPRTLQSLALVSEVIYGAPSRFKDPARFSFAHGGKDGHPFPVPVETFDETIHTLRSAVEHAKIGQADKQEAIKKLHEIARRAEKDFTPSENLDKLIEKERNESWKYGGRTVLGKATPPGNTQLKLF